MKNNRILTAILATLLLASTLTSCSRRDQFRPPETEVPTGEQTTVAGQPDVNNPGETNPTDTNQSGGDVTDPGTTTPDIPIGDPSTGDAENGKITGNPYEGWTAEQLYASFMADREKSGINNVNGRFGNTPYYVILDVQYGGYMFSKLTGQVVQICKDPLCDHKTCIFNHLTSWMGRSCQVADDRCYLLISDYKGDQPTYILYSFDLLMNDAQLVCEWRDHPGNVYVYQGKVYYGPEMKFDDGQYGRVTMVYDMKEKTTYPLHEQPVRCSVIQYAGAYAWYTNEENGALGRYRLDTGENEVILPSSLLDAEAGDLSFVFNGISGQTVYVRKNMANYNHMYLGYDMETGKFQELGVITPFIYDGTFYPIVRQDVDANKDDLHYEYYSVGHACWGGKVYRTDAKTGELHEIVNLRTDDIPDALVDFFFLDGKFLMIKYQTYKDFKNPYSLNLPEWARSDRYVVVNMETGTVYELGVDLSNQSYHKWLEKHEKHER